MVTCASFEAKKNGPKKTINNQSCTSIRKSRQKHVVIVREGEVGADGSIKTDENSLEINVVGVA